MKYILCEGLTRVIVGRAPTVSLAILYAEAYEEEHGVPVDIVDMDSLPETEKILEALDALQRTYHEEH